MSADVIGEETWTALKSHLLDCITLIIAGRTSPRVRRAVQATEMHDPAFALSLACGALGLDDFDEATRTHPGAALVPALIAAAAGRSAPVTGKDFAVSLLVGYETFKWLGAAMDARHMHQRGRHPSTMVGMPAVAVAVARLLGSAKEEIQGAVGVGAALACGLTEFDAKEDMRAVQTAWAASSGVKAAQLAKAGFRPSPYALEAAGGLLKGSTASVPPIEEFGEQPFAVELVSFKPYAHFSDLHPATSALLRAVQGRRVMAEEVATMHVHITPTAVARLHRALPPRTSKEAKRCAEYVLAACLLGDGSGEPVPSPTIDDTRIGDRSVLALAEQVQVVADLPEPAGSDDHHAVDRQVVARVEVVLRSGEVCSGTSTGYPGDGRDPALRWTLDDARNRFDALALPAISQAGITPQAVLSIATDLPRLADVRPTAQAIAALPYAG
ncbi:MmgE/PrpD family protein [Mycolicibacterium agri]|nr:MmgE/PrpD family protein [Mycolicibacterium agri]